MNKLTDIDSYPYPETVTMDILATVAASQVRKGDRVAKDSTEVTVGEVTVGTKWVTLRDQDGRLVRKLAVDDLITVFRSKETEASREAFNRAETNRRLCKALSQNLRDGLTTAQVTFNRKLDEWNQISSFDLDDLLTTQAHYRIWATFAAYVESAGQDMATDDTTDLVEIMTAYREELTQWMLKDYTHKALSRSTSVTSNLLDDVYRQEVAKFLDRSMRYGF